jgi:DNA-binding response OmpR family regulator
VDTTYRILIVEDDATIARVIKEHLAVWGYDVSLAEDFRKVAGQAAVSEPHLILLDIKLPFYNGFHWCAEIRKSSKVPIVFISSADDNMSLVMAMNMGGDDFIAKPFDLSVLTAKIQALLRRTYDFMEYPDSLERSGATLYPGDSSIVYDGKKLELTKNENRILQALMERSGRSVSREMLMQRLWESDSFIDDNTLTVNINRLRKKLSKLGLRDFIKTKKGQGYEIE